MSQSENKESLLTSTGFYSLFQTLPLEIRQGFLQLLFQNNSSELEDSILYKINDRKVLTKVRKCIEAIGTSQTLSEIPDLEPLKGFSGYYRIKFDYSYRIGIF